MLENLEFISKIYFWLFLFFPIIIFFIFQNRKNNSLKFVFFEEFKSSFSNNFWGNSFIFYTKIFFILAILTNFILLFANPNLVNTDKKITKNWIDIVIALDISWSMDAEDLKPSRIEVAKNVIWKFIWKLSSDRLWFVVFAWKPFTSIPLTFDYEIAKETLENISTKNINQQIRWLNWTAVWDAILMSKNIFKPENEKNKNREKVLILLTDWDANVWVDPVLAAKLLKKDWIKIYTIWIWSKNWWLISYNFWGFKRQQMVPPLNEKSLKEIAKISDWEFFRAENNFQFEKIFKELEKLSTDDVEVEIKKTYEQDYKFFLNFLIWLILSFIIFLVLNWVEFRKNKI